jgi:hypothetical protein
MVQPVFEKEILRETDSEMFQGFLDNADNTGTTLQDINETAQTHARMLGLTFIIMDNFPDAGSVRTMRDAIDQRKFPYVYEKMPHEVYRWKCDNWGKLEWITFFERQETLPDPDHQGKFIIRQYYRRWNKEKWQIYYEKHNPAKFEEVIEIVEEEAVHGLNYIPIYPVLDYTKNNNLTNFPTPKFADLANMAFILYNMESWIELLCVYCFPTLTLPGEMDTSQISMSANNAIAVPSDAKFPPGFIAPPTACLEVLLKAADRLEDKIYKAANQLGVYGTKAQSSKQMVSGVSKEWDFQASNSLLTKTSFAAKKLEEWCSKTFTDYTHTVFSFTVDFGTEFIQAYSNQRLDQIMNLIKDIPPKPLEKELWKEAAKVFFEDDADKSKEITDAIDRQYAQEIKDKAVIEGKILDGKPGDGDNQEGDNPGGDNPPAKSDDKEGDSFKSMINSFLKMGKAA